MQLEVGRYRQVEHVLARVHHAAYLMGAGFIKKVHIKHLLTVVLTPYMQLLLVVGNEGPGILVIKYLLDGATARCVSVVGSGELVTELYRLR